MKKILFNKGQFLTSAPSLDALPVMQNSRGATLPEIACIGRSNVGKSSLLNHLLSDKSLARVSSTPGKTQLLNLYTVDEKLLLVDLPGYGYAKVPKKMKASWAKSIETYLKNRSSVVLLLLLLDSRRLPSEEDLAFINWATFYKKPFLLLFTKADKLDKGALASQINTSLALIKKEIATIPSFDYLPYSIKDAAAREKLIEKINSALCIVLDNKINTEEFLHDDRMASSRIAE